MKQKPSVYAESEKRFKITPTSDASKWRHPRYLWSRVRRAVDFAIDAAPVLTALKHNSHPIAYIAALSHLGRKVAPLFQKDKTIAWDISFDTRSLIIELLVQHGAGIIVDRIGTTDIRLLGETEFGADSEDVFGPWGPPDDPAIPKWIWDHFPAIQITTKVNYKARRETALIPDDLRTIFEPSLRVQALGEDCVRLRQNGLKVGILIDGPPGTGKSQALLHIAQRLGGKSLRASLATTDPSTIVDVARVLRPDAILFDDIDRTDSAPLLDAVDIFGQLGIAVLATSNKASKICDALLRSGRIDERHHFGAIEPDVFDRYTSQITEEERIVLQDHTVATFIRYLEMRDTLGQDRARAFLATAKPVKSAPLDAKL